MAVHTNPRLRTVLTLGITTVLRGQHRVLEGQAGKMDGAALPKPLSMWREQTAREGSNRGVLNKGREDKAVVPENSGEWRGGPKCQRPEVSALSPRSLLTTFETMGAIWYTLMVSQALCQALDWLNFPSWEAGNGNHPLER